MLMSLMTKPVKSAYAERALDLYDRSPQPMLVGGRYRLDAQIGAGSTGTVWMAQDERLRRRVAVKELPRGRTSEPGAGLREACAAAQVQHVGAVKVYDVIVDEREATDWVVMEALSGEDLATTLKSIRRIGVAEARYIGQHVLAALASVHEAGLVHRDVKPANIRLCDDGRVVLMDFGLATAPCTTGGAEAGNLVGSLPYLAPEILREGHYSSASDLYALGVTLFVAITGRTAGSAKYDLVAGIQAVIDLESLSAGAHPLAQLLAGLLAHNPAERSSIRAAQRHLTCPGPLLEL